MLISSVEVYLEKKNRSLRLASNFFGAKMLKYRSKMAFLTYGSATIILLVVGYLVGSLSTLPSGGCPDISCNRTLSAVSTADAALKSAAQSDMSRSNVNYGDKVQQAEQIFETTMRSCLGTFCFDDAVRTKDGKEIVRVGIVVPGIAEGERIRNMLISAGIPLNEKLELVAASNVPPYGYGKNHGWSRIIRIVRPVVPHSIHLLSREDSISAVLVDKLIDPQVRQLMRWHCRLSHVAAHTAMLTVHTDQFLARPVTELEKMLTFAGYKPSRENLLTALDAHLPGLKEAWDDTAVLRAFQSNATHSGVIGISAQATLDKAASAVSKEMAETQNLTKWPCRSFRDFKDKAVVKQLPLSVKALAADCGAPYVKCSVRYDQDEFKRLTAGQDN